MRNENLPLGSNFYKCAACGAYFLNVRAFDYHRRTTTGVGRENAVSVTTCTSFDALEQDERGYWRFPKREYKAWNK